jgi:hypothetical protein
MRLLHYSYKPIDRLFSRRQRVHMKPRGLWLSVEGEDDWDNWCRREGFRNHDDYYIYEVELADNANVLYITNAHELDEFTREYGSPETIGGKARPSPSDYGYDIDWPRLAREYDGIIIAPYIWSRRMESITFWYYGWDCASGCIWRKRAIRRLNEVRLPIIPDEDERAIRILGESKMTAAPAIYTDSVMGF